MRILKILVLLFPVLNIVAQSRFYKLYSGTGFDRGEDIIELPDSSFLVAGTSGSWEDNAQGFLMKLDSLGNYQWSHAYGAEEAEEIKRVFYRPGLGYYLAGMSSSWNPSNYDPMLIFTDLSGNQQWIKTYESPDWERINDGVQTLDTGLILIGERQPVLGTASQVLVMRLDKNGDTIWTQSFGTEGADCANSIIRLSDTTYAIGGKWFVSDSSATKGFVALIHEDGQLIWLDTLGHLSGDFEVLDITKNLYGIQFAGYHLNQTSDYDKFSGSIDLDGIILTQVAPFDGLNSDEIIQQLAYIAQQDVTILGIQELNDFTFDQPYDLYFGYGDAYFGYWLTGWPSTTILNQGNDQVGNICATMDGGFAAVGMNSVIVDGQNQLNGGSNVFVLKLNGDGSAYIQTDTVFTTHQLVGLKPIFNGSGIRYFPNPSSHFIHFQWDGNEQKQVSLYDCQGNIIFYKYLASDQSIDVSFWSNGLYLLRIDGKSYPIIKN